MKNANVEKVDGDEINQADVINPDSQLAVVAQQHLSVIADVETSLAMLEEDLGEVGDVSNPVEYAAEKVNQKALAKLRTKGNAARLAATAGYRDRAKDINSSWSDDVEPRLIALENPRKEALKAEDDRLAAIEAEALAKEAERVARIDERIRALFDIGSMNDPVDSVIVANGKIATIKDQQAMAKELFEERTEDAMLLIADKLASLETLKTKLEETERVQAEQARQAETLRQQKEENERQQKANEAETERLRQLGLKAEREAEEREQKKAIEEKEEKERKEREQQEQARKEKEIADEAERQRLHNEQVEADRKAQAKAENERKQAEVQALAARRQRAKELLPELKKVQVVLGRAAKVALKFEGEENRISNDPFAQSLMDRYVDFMGQLNNEALKEIQETAETIQLEK